MSNLILWAHQCTVDYNYRVGDAIGNIAKEILAKGLLSTSDEARTVVEGVRDHGIFRDRKVQVNLDDLNGIRALLEEKGYRRPDIQIGGDPAISAIRGHLLRLGPPPGASDLPLVYYAGLLPRSVENVLEELHEIRSAFHVTSPVPEEPQSVGLEADVAKLIFIYAPGRSIGLLAPDGDFTDFLGRLASVVAGSPDSRVVLAVNAARPGMVPVKSKDAFKGFLDTAAELANKHIGRLVAEGKVPPNEEVANIEEFKEDLVEEKGQKVSDLIFLLHLLKEVKRTDFGDRVRTFVATRDFGDIPHFPKHVLPLLDEADIVSANDAEIDALHTAYQGSFEKIPRAYKLRELPFKAIKICHSADGVIMDLGCRPEAIITSEKFSEDPAGFLEEVLRLSADGATYAMDATAGFGRMANEAMIRIYSHNVTYDSRQHERFRAAFLQITQPLPAGMISVPSARVVRTLGAIVGLGAIFDGLLLSFMMRD